VHRRSRGSATNVDLVADRAGAVHERATDALLECPVEPDGEVVVGHGGHGRQVEGRLAQALSLGGYLVLVVDLERDLGIDLGDITKKKKTNKTMNE